MALLAVTDILRDINTISNSLNGNVLIVQARKDIKEELRRSGLSQEERDRLYANFSQQLALGLVAQAINLAKEIPPLIQEVEKLKEDAAILDIQRSKTSSKLDAEIAVLAEQKKGFLKDMFYKTLKLNSENSAMLAQAGIVTPGWMTTAMKTAISKMTDGQISP